MGWQQEHSLNSNNKNSWIKIIFISADLQPKIIAQLFYCKLVLGLLQFICLLQTLTLSCMKYNAIKIALGLIVQFCSRDQNFRAFRIQNLDVRNSDIHCI